jgi:tetratricopeptide (TPR) repeat protein
MLVAGAAATLLTVFSVFVACMVIAWPVYRIVTLWLDNAIGWGEAMLGIFILLAFLAGIMRTWGQLSSIFLWLLLLALALVIVVGGRVRNRRRLDGFFRADIAAAGRALAKDPENAAAHMRLASLRERQRDYETAIHHYQEVVRIVPRDSEARLALAHCIEKQRRTLTGNLTCWRCGRENAGDAAHCHGCGSLISDRNLIVGWLTSRGMTRATAAVAIVSVAIAVAGSVARVVPLWATIPCYALLFVAVLCYVYPRWSQPKGWRREASGR